MQEPPTCPTCGTPLAADVPDGHCLACLLGLALARDGPDEDGDESPAPSDHSFPGYRIREKIGEGGCGEVFRATQETPLRREVAVKVIKPGMDSALILTRFEAERQALALMNHPNIAKILDAGISNLGRPFFAMELVPGQSITAYSDRLQLPIPDRLALFLQVCEAVRHAHLKGVIHRDLKPSNILVSETDGRPVAKVIDFGIAKATGPERLADRTLYTVFDQFLGTPAYMSPEQAGLTGDDIDARSDVYSLGVLLYELLTGKTPFDPKSLRSAAIAEVYRIIREAEPALPSARLTALSADDLTATATRRLLASRRLVGELRGDLDGIVMKAIEKDRDRRYDTAGELAADIQRHLRHEPVTARPPGPLYRFWKFARRNRLAVVSGAVGFCCLVAGLAVTSWMYFKERRARETLEQHAYLSDMSSAARMATLDVGGLGGTVRLLDAWHQRRPDLRGWEWYYLNGLCHRELLTIRADATELWSVSWSPDGSRIATGGAEGAVKIWDAATGKALATWRGHSRTVTVVAWSPDGSWLASAGVDKTVRIWDAARATCRVLPGHDEAAGSLAWSPDGNTLASGSVDGTVKLWNPVTAAATRTLTAAGPVTAVCWSGDGSRLIAVGTRGMGYAWDAATGRKLWSIPTGDDGMAVTAVASSPDARQLVTCESDNAIHFRDPASGDKLGSVWDSRNLILAIAWTADGSRFATATRGDGRVVIRDARAGGRVIRDFRGHLGSVRSVAWRPDGAWLASASADGTVRIWDAIGDCSSSQKLHQPDQPKDLAWSPDGTKLAAGCRRMDAWIWDFSQAPTPMALDGGFTPWTLSVAWSPDGTRLASAGTDGIRVWDSATQAMAWQDQTALKALRAVAWRPDGRQLAAVNRNRELALWNAATGKLVQSLALPPGDSGSLAWSPDGRTLATGSGPDIHLWDAQLKPLKILTGHRDSINRLVWSPDGTRLASAGGDTSAKIWNPGTGRPLHDLLGHGAPVHGLAWSPDGARLATVSWDMTLKIWGTVTGTEVCSFHNPAGTTQVLDAVAWHPDGRRIAIADLEGNIGILDSTPGWLDKPGSKAPTPPVRSATAQAAASRSLRLYCDTTEPHAANDPDVLRRLAWIRATAPYPEVRDARKAVAFGEQANRLVGGSNSSIRSILAAAYAEAGDFAKAVAIGKTTSDAEALKRYQASRPSRDHSW